MFSRVLFPALMEAGAGKQNAVVVIVVRRYAGLVRIVGCFAVSEDLTNYFTLRAWRTCSARETIPT